MIAKSCRFSRKMAMQTSRDLCPSFNRLLGCTGRRTGRELVTTVRLETAKFSKACPKGRARYYLGEKADAGSIPKSTLKG